MKTKTILFEYLSHPYKIIHYDWVFLHTIYHISFLLVGVCATFTWSRRMKIALDAAKGLAFLHGAERPIIYRDFKTSNILLDSVSFPIMFSDLCSCFSFRVFPSNHELARNFRFFILEAFQKNDSFIPFLKNNIPLNHFSFYTMNVLKISFLISFYTIDPTLIL